MVSQCLEVERYSRAHCFPFADLEVYKIFAELLESQVRSRKTVIKEYVHIIQQFVAPQNCPKNAAQKAHNQMKMKIHHSTSESSKTN